MKKTILIIQFTFFPILIYLLLYCLVKLGVSLLVYTLCGTVVTVGAIWIILKQIRNNN